MSSSQNTTPSRVSNRRSSNQPATPGSAQRPGSTRTSPTQPQPAASREPDEVVLSGLKLAGQKAITRGSNHGFPTNTIRMITWYAFNLICQRLIDQNVAESAQDARDELRRLSSKVGGKKTVQGSVYDYVYDFFDNRGGNFRNEIINHQEELKATANFFKNQAGSDKELQAIEDNIRGMFPQGTSWGGWSLGGPSLFLPGATAPTAQEGPPPGSLAYLYHDTDGANGPDAKIPDEDESDEDDEDEDEGENEE